MFGYVLFPLDLHESERRIASVLELLQRLGTERVLLLHVVGGEVDHARRARARLEERAQLVTGAGFRCDTMLRRGSTASVVVDVARWERVDMICVPWKRKGWLQRTIVGSVTTDVVRLSDVPVLVHKEGRRRGNTSAPGTRVLYATDFQATDAAMTPYVKHVGSIAHTLHLLNVRDRAPDPEAEEKREREVKANLERIARECGGDYEVVEQSAVLGTPRKTIPRYAVRNGIDLVLLGRADTTAPLSGIIGSTAEEVAHSTRSSLFIVPPVALARREPSTPGNRGSAQGTAARPGSGGNGGSGGGGGSGNASESAT